MAAYTSVVCWPLHSSAAPPSLWGAWQGLGWGDWVWTRASADCEGPPAQWSCFPLFPLVVGPSCHLHVKSQKWGTVRRENGQCVLLCPPTTTTATTTPHFLHTFVAEVVLASSSIAGRTGRAGGPVLVRWVAPPVSPVQVIPQIKLIQEKR